MHVVKLIMIVQVVLEFHSLMAVGMNDLLLTQSV